MMVLIKKGDDNDNIKQEKKRKMETKQTYNGEQNQQRRRQLHVWEKKKKKKEGMCKKKRRNKSMNVLVRINNLSHNSEKLITASLFPHSHAVVVVCMPLISQSPLLHESKEKSNNVTPWT